MATAAQIIANRQNSQNSTGPVTEAGRAASSRNALQHGLTSKQVVLPHEDASEYERLRTQLQQDYKAANLLEQSLVDKIAQNWWRLQRAYGTETAFLTNRIEQQQTDSPSLSAEAAAAMVFIDPAETARMKLVMRYIASAERAYNKAVSDLNRIQTERRRMERDIIESSWAQQLQAEPATQEPESVQPEPELASFRSAAVAAAGGPHSESAPMPHARFAGTETYLYGLESIQTGKHME